VLALKRLAQRAQHSVPNRTNLIFSVKPTEVTAIQGEKIRIPLVTSAEMQFTLFFFFFFFFLGNCRVIAIERFRKNCFSSGMLATLPLAPSL